MRLLIIVAPLVILLFGLACSTSKPTTTPVASAEWVEQTTQTTSYKVKVRTGPMVTMEVMQQGATMTMMDQGQPVNHHLEVYVFDKNTGAEVKKLIPKVTITDQATGTARGLPDVQACLLANHRATEPHFGDNLYLSDGKYAVAVNVGNDTAVFENVVVKAPK
jgi:hypothetical protein